MSLLTVFFPATDFPFGAKNSPVTVNSTHKGQWRGALVFSLIWARINSWGNNGDAGDLRRNRAHYDVIVMVKYKAFTWHHAWSLLCWEQTNTSVLNSSPNTILDDEVIKRKQFPHYWPFVRGVHRSPMNSPQKGKWRGALMFSLICAWINGWVNNREAGDFETLSRPLWRHCNDYSKHFLGSWS